MSLSSLIFNLLDNLLLLARKVILLKQMQNTYPAVTLLYKESFNALPYKM